MNMNKEATKFFQTEFDLSRKRLQMAAELQAVKDSAGAAALDALMEGTDTSPIARKIADAEGQISLMDAAIRVSRQKRKEAVEAGYRAAADEFRKEARKKVAEADRRQARTDRLLAELREFEGVDYVPTRSKTSAPSFAADHQQTTGLGHSVSVVRVPITDYMRMEAADLEQKARQTEAKKIKSSGSVSGESVEEVIGALEDLGVEVLGPPIVEVAAWMSSGLASGPEKQRSHYQASGQAGATAPILFEIHFTNGELDKSSSTTRLAIPA